MRRLLLPAIAVALALGSAPAGAQTSAAIDDVQVTDLAALASGTLLAVGTVDGCDATIDPSGCTRLLRSDDLGATWTVAAADGWSGGRIVTAQGDDGPVLVSPTLAPGTLERSTDLGETWSGLDIDGRLVGRAGRADLVFTVDGTAVASVDPVSGESVQLFLRMPEGLDVDAAVTLPSDQQEVIFATGLAGADSQVARCVEFDCEVVWESDTTVLGVAIAEGEDTVVVHDDTGTMWLSADVGRTFIPRTIAGLPGDAAVSITDVAIDGSTLYAAVTAADAGALEGPLGVYSSTDRGATWTHLGEDPVVDGGVAAIVAVDGRLGAVGTSTRGFVCLGAEGWAPDCSGAPIGDAGPPDASTTSSTTDAPETSTTTSAPSPRTTVEAGPSSSARTASNAFFAIAAVVVAGCAGVALRNRRRERRPR